MLLMICTKKSSNLTNRYWDMVPDRRKVDGRMDDAKTISHRLCREVIIRGKFNVSKLNSLSRLSTNYRNTTFWPLEAGTCVADVPRSFGCNEQTICLQTRFRQPGSKNDKLPPGRPRITTPLEGRLIVTSSWRNRIIVACKLHEHLRHATGTRISVYTARNRLRGARLIFEFWNLIDPFVQFWWRKGVYFQKVLLKMFTYVGT